MIARHSIRSEARLAISETVSLSRLQLILVDSLMPNPSLAQSPRHRSQATGSVSIQVIATVSVTLLAGLGAIVWMNIDPDPVTLLARDLQSDETNERYKAAKELEELGPNAAAAVAELAKALSDTEPKVRYRAAKALSRIGPPAVPAVPALAEALNDVERDVRYYAAKAIYKIDDDANDALEPIIRVLDGGEPDPDVRRYLVKSLKEIGKQSKEANRVVKKLVGDRDDRVRKEVEEFFERYEEAN